MRINPKASVISSYSPKTREGEGLLLLLSKPNCATEDRCKNLQQNGPTLQRSVGFLDTVTWEGDTSVLEQVEGALEWVRGKRGHSQWQPLCSGQNHAHLVEEELKGLKALCFPFVLH